MSGGASVHASHFLTTTPTENSSSHPNCVCPMHSGLYTLDMCGECRSESNAARKRAWVSYMMDMSLKVTDRTDKSPCGRRGFSGEHASDVPTEPTEGPSRFLPARACSKMSVGTAANINWVCCAVQVGFREATRYAPFGPWATGADTAYRPTSRSSRWPRRRWCAFGANPWAEGGPVSDDGQDVAR